MAAEDMTLQSSNYFYVGVDGGGTKCRAEAYNAKGEVIGAGVAGPANVARAADIARQSIVNAVAAALADAGLAAPEQLRKTAVGAGLAGANLPSASDALNNWQHPFAAFSFTSDLHAAMLGAHGGSDGAVLVVGTGSCAAALTGGKLQQFGGHGFTLGDKGSGAWMGRQAVVHTLEVLDGVQEGSALAKAVCDHYQCHTPLALVDRLNQAPPAHFGQLSPVLLQLAGDGDAAATQIIESGAQYLTAIARKAIALSGNKLVLVGGVAGSITPWLADDVQQAIVHAQHGPEWGAFYYQQHAK